MGCFGAGSKQPDSAGGSSEDTKSQKRRSDAITKQLQKDKQVIFQRLGDVIGLPVY
jgi:guanine nucleotide-binding protein G(s) subunit alpha